MAGLVKRTAEAKEAAQKNRSVLRVITKKNKAAYRKFRTMEKRLRARRVEPSAYKPKMKDPTNLLEVEDLKSYFYTDIGTVKAVDGVTLDIPAGKTVGIVGESGCGKSVLSLSVIRLLQGPVGQIAGGAIRFHGGECAIDLL